LCQGFSLKIKNVLLFSVVTQNVLSEDHTVAKRQIGDTRRVVCYYANWAVYRQGTAKFTPQNINPYLCTHLIYAFGGLGKDDTIQTFDKYQDLEKGTRRS
jgi:GH18 family chitinase